MAKFVSTIFSSIRGSVAGTTYLTTPSGQIIGRQRTVPCNPQTSKQTEIRSQFASAIGAWEGLTDSVRSGWDAYADSLGTGQTGRQVFISNYTLGKYLALNSSGIVTLSTSAPTDPGVLAIENVSAITYVGPGTGVSISWEIPGADDCVAYVQISNAQSAARARFQGPFRSDNAEVAASAGSSATFQEFDGLTEDAVYFMRLRVLTADTPFRKSAEYIVRAVAETVV